MQVDGKYDISDKLFVYRELARAIETDVVEFKSPVIIDATFSHQAMRNLFSKLANKIAVPLKFIWVWADEKLIRERTNKLREDSEADYNVFLKLRGQVEAVDIPHLKLESTNSNIETMLKKAITYILSYERK